jgi:group I intron endonuclease
MTSNIYVITNKINNKKYVGQTINPNSRFNQHIISSKKDTNIFLYNAINKYGNENFSFDLVEIDIPIEDVNEREKDWISKLKTKKPYGYNLTDGGEGTLGYKHTNETKEKLSKMKKGVPNHPQTEETKRKISKANKGRKMSPESIEKAKKAKIGKKLSAEHKNKLRATLTGMPKPQSQKENLKKYWNELDKETKQSRIESMISQRCTQVAMLNVINNAEIQYFNSMRKAAEWLRSNTNYKTASHTRIGVICGDLTKSAYGFKWTYK